jgi:hypothetical protein
MTLVNRTGAPRTLENMTEGPPEKLLPPREVLVELTPLEELRQLDQKRVDRNAIRGRLNLQEYADEKRRAFLLGRMAKQAPQMETKVQKSIWADELVTADHQWDESPMKGVNNV